MIKSTAILLAIALCAATVCIEPGGTMKPVGSISGTAFKVIQIAMPKCEQRGLHIDKYMISVLEDNQSYFVLFEDPDRPQSLRGGSSKFPEYNVEISKSKLKVISAAYPR